MREIYKKFEKLKEYILKLDKVAVAYSGGVDSTFLLKVAFMVLGDNCTAYIAKSPVFPEKEIDEAVEFCKKEKIKHEIINFDNFSVENFKNNPVNRCYICKLALFKNIIARAKKNGTENILEGSNFDDIGDYRPGMKAIKELKVLSPLKESQLTKAEIRALSKESGLYTYSKPALACLATRFPYNEEITLEKLKMVELAEKVLFDSGFKQARVRIHGNVARIEVLVEEMRLMFSPIREKIVSEFKNIGFRYVSLDLEGYRTGSMNEVINI